MYKALFCACQKLTLICYVSSVDIVLTTGIYSEAMQAQKFVAVRISCPTIVSV